MKRNQRTLATLLTLLLAWQGVVQAETETPQACIVEQPGIQSLLTPEPKTQEQINTEALLEYYREQMQTAYRKELALQQTQHTGHDDPRSWVDVHITGTPPGGELPAVSAPETLRSSVQFHRHQYLVKPGDKLAISVLGDDSPDDAGGRQSTVLSDGTIVMPMIGQVAVAGKTPAELSRELSEKMRSYYRFAQVTVNLSEPGPDSVLVLGSVNRQGYVKVPSGTTVSEIFGPVRGMTSQADVHHVFVRKKSDGQVYMVDLEAFFTKGDMAHNVILQDGDVVLVPEGKAVLDYARYARTPLLEDSFDVKVLGAVKQAGTVEVKPGDTLSTALAKAGGTQPHARSNTITLFRADPRTRAVKSLELRQADLVNPAKTQLANVSLQPDDTIIVNDPRWKRLLYTLMTLDVTGPSE